MIAPEISEHVLSTVTLEPNNDHFDGSKITRQHFDNVCFRFKDGSPKGD